VTHPDLKLQHGPQGQVRVLEIGDIVIECRIDAELTPSALRAFAGTTPLDSEVDQMSVPAGPSWLRLAVLALRWYRTQLGPRLGQRCVFEPSCSRYAELALRRRGFLLGSTLTVRRLARCRPGNGGVDCP